MVKNNTVVLITNIVASGTTLVCATQKSSCCAAMGTRDGEWYYPNSTRVPVNGAGYSFYRTRRDASSGVLGGALLNRRHDARSPVGIYGCVIGGADVINQMLYVGLYTSASNGKCAQL